MAIPKNQKLVAVKALQSFSGPRCSHHANEEFSVTQKVAKDWIKRGYVEKLPDLAALKTTCKELNAELKAAHEVTKARAETIAELNEKLADRDVTISDLNAQIEALTAQAGDAEQGGLGLETGKN